MIDVRHSHSFPSSHAPSAVKVLFQNPILAFAGLALSFVSTALDAAEVRFLRDVAPILLQRCAGCHGPKVGEGGYRVHTFEGLMHAGDSTAIPVVASHPERSELLRRVIEPDERKRMPQKDDPLSAEEVDVLRQWIASGARFDGVDAAASLRSQLPPRRHPEPPESYRVPVPIFALAFSPDSTELAVGGYNEVMLWEVETGRLSRRLKRLPRRIHALRWTRDSAPEGGGLLVGGGSPGEYGELALVDPGSGERRHVYGTFDDIVLATALSSKGDRVGVGSADRSTRVYKAATGELLWQTLVHSDWVTGVAFSPDDRFVVTASRDQTVKVYDANTGTLYTTYNGHRRQFGDYTGRFAVYDVIFDPESGRALSVGEGRSIRVWEPVKAKEENGAADDMEERFSKAGHTRYIEFKHDGPAFQLGVTGGQVLLAGADVVRQFDRASGKQVRDYAGHTDVVYCVAIDPSARRIAAGAFDGEVRIWTSETGAVLHAFRAAPGFEE